MAISFIIYFGFKTFLNVLLEETFSDFQHPLVGLIFQVKTTECTELQAVLHKHT